MASKMFQCSKCDYKTNRKLNLQRHQNSSKTKCYFTAEVVLLKPEQPPILLKPEQPQSMEVNFIRELKRLDDIKSQNKLFCMWSVAILRVHKQFKNEYPDYQAERRELVEKMTPVLKQIRQRRMKVVGRQLVKKITQG